MVEEAERQALLRSVLRFSGVMGQLCSCCDPPRTGCKLAMRTAAPLAGCVFEPAAWRMAQLSYGRIGGSQAF